MKITTWCRCNVQECRYSLVHLLHHIWAYMPYHILLCDLLVYYTNIRTSFHMTYLMLGWWHLDIMLMRHSAKPTERLLIMQMVCWAAWLTGAKKMMCVIDICLILATPALNYCLGATQTYRIHWAFARRNSDKTGECYAYDLFKRGCLILHDPVAPSG